MRKKNLQSIIIPLSSGFLISIMVTIADPGTAPLNTFLSTFSLSFIFVFILFFAWKKVNPSPKTGWLTATTFGIRILIGILLFLSLPVFGYDEEPPNYGYLYLDAFQRDTDAWELASSGSSLTCAFRDEFYSDQYGGLLSLSAALYRVFSPYSHRPLLIVILTAFFSALGLPFFDSIIRKQWGNRIADICSWIYVLYPESVILGASQMREPILIGLSALLLWSLFRWADNKKSSITASILCVIGLVFISVKAAGAIIFTAFLYYWLVYLGPKLSNRLRFLSLLFLLIILGAGLFASWGWFVDSSIWDLYLMESASGRIQWELELIGKRFRTPFIVAYGILQPVLPATIVYPGIPIMRAISIFRALGWYALLPTLLTSSILVWRTKKIEKKGIIFLFMAIVAIWTVISSARAGGDQWDNPRYRSILFIWYALLGSWAIFETQKRKSPWLWRIVLLEIIYTGFFIHWYLSRYFGVFKRMDFWPMIRLLIIIGGIILFGGLIFDWVYQKFRSGSEKESG